MSLSALGTVLDARSDKSTGAAGFDLAISRETSTARDQGDEHCDEGLRMFFWR